MLLLTKDQLVYFVFLPRNATAEKLIELQQDNLADVVWEASLEDFGLAYTGRLLSRTDEQNDVYVFDNLDDAVGFADMQISKQIANLA